MLYYPTVPASRLQYPPVNPLHHTGFYCQEGARREVGAGAVDWRQLSRLCSCRKKPVVVRARRLVASSYLPVVTKEPLRRLQLWDHSLLLCGSAPQGATVCGRKEWPSRWAKKKHACFPIIHCPVGAGCEGVICAITIIVMTTVPWIFLGKVSVRPNEGLEFLCTCTFGECWCRWHTWSLMKRPG